MADKKVVSAPADDEAFLALARDRFKLVAQAEMSTRKESLDDLEFSVGNQWPQQILTQRQLDGRPCLAINRLPQFIRQVTNEQRQQRPAIQINPIGDGADVDTAEVYEGIMRHIERLSHASEVYDLGCDYMVRIGFGCWRILTSWIHEESEDQEIYIVPIDNPFTVYLDPTNKRDPGWGFIVEDLLAAEFQRQFPEARYSTGNANLSDYESVGDTPAVWASTIDGQPSIRIAEYFWVEKSKGHTGREARKVYWSKISGLDILDKKDWPGKYIPIIKIYGDDLIVNGKRYISGLVRYAKDPQRAYNYWMSAATERIALASKAPWIMAEGQIEGHEEAWRQSNIRNINVLTYKQVDAGGKPAPPPTQNIAEPSVQGMTEMLQLATMDMQATTGLNDANLGRPKPDESGKAVLARQKQGDIATLNYSENLGRGIEQTGTIIMDLIPKVYTAARIQRIIKPDGTVQHVGIYNSKNGESKEDAAKAVNDPNIKKLYDIGTGRYDVGVSVGPSYQAKRQEAVVSQMALVQAFPEVFSIIGDQMVANMDWPGAKEMSQRLKKMLPPQLQDDGGDDPENKLVQAQQQLAQLSQQHQQLAQALQQATDIIKTKQVENQGKTEIAQLQEQSAQTIQKMKIDAQIAVAEITTKAQSALERAQMYKEVWTELHGGAHELGMQKDQQAHEQSLAQQQAAVAAASQQSSQAADQQSQQSDQGHQMVMAAQQPQGEGE